MKHFQVLKPLAVAALAISFSSIAIARAPGGGPPGPAGGVGGVGAPVVRAPARAAAVDNNVYVAPVPRPVAVEGATSTDVVVRPAPAPAARRRTAYRARH